MSEQLISLVTNVSANDYNRIKLVFPHWLRVFGKRIADFSVILDRTPPTGRLAYSPGKVDPKDEHTRRLIAVESLLRVLSEAEPRIRVHEMPQPTALKENTEKWFGNSTVDVYRCQAGTPIAAFIAAWESGQQQIVLRADCDMLFFEAGWLDKGIDMLLTGEADMIEPPRGQPDNGNFKVTTRAAMIDVNAFRRRVLPIHPYSLGWIRTMERRLRGRPRWLALEQMLQREREKGRLRYKILGPELGQWLHVALTSDAGLPFMPRVAEAVRKGHIPKAQMDAGWDFNSAAWET